MIPRMSAMLACVALCLTLPRSVTAQEPATITGRVTNEGGAPLPYANVFIQSLGIATQTAATGTYTLNVPGARVSGQAVTLSVRAIGYRQATAQVTLRVGRIEQNFSLEANPLRLGEVVVTGAGTQSSIERLAASVSSVKTEEIIKSNEINSVQALAAKAPGVVVTSSSGEPGASPYIQMRGQTSLQGASQPLFVVDGIPVDNSTTVTTASQAGTSAMNRMADLNPGDIESVELLKGAAAAAIYGARAGSGVVLITTKRGRPGATRWNLRTTYSQDRVNRDYPLQRKFGQGSAGQAARCGGFDCRLTGGSFGPALAAGTPTYNHFMEMFETGNLVDATLSVSGGSDRTSFYLSTGTVNHEGVIVGGNDSFQRSTVLLKGSHAATDRLQITSTLNYADTHGSFIQRGSNLSGLLLGALRTAPEYDNRQYRDPTNGLHRSYRFPRPSPTSQYLSRNYDNPFFIAHEMKNTSDVGRLFGNVNIDYTATPWLSLKYTLGADYSSDARIEALPPSNSTQPTGQIDRANLTIQLLDHNLLATAEKQLTTAVKGGLTVGQNLSSRKFERLQVRGIGFIAPDLFQLSNTVSSNLLPLDNETLVRMESYFGEGRLDLWEQVYLTAGVRNDASSTFGASVRRNWFPKASAAWEFSRYLGRRDGEGLLSFGKMRVAYGQTGREPLPYQVFSGYTTGLFTDLWTVGLNQSQGGNAGIFLAAAKGQDRLKPERNTELEYGVDLAFFDSRIDVGVTRFDAKSTDGILLLPVPPSTGFFTQVQNAAEITNKGWEVSVNARAISTPNVTWTVGANWSTTRNLVTDLRGADEFFLATGFVSGVKAGHAFGIFLGQDFGRCRYSESDNVIDGIDINAVCRAANARDGAMYIGADGYPIFDPTQRVVGDPNPDWTGSISSGLTVFRKLQISALVDVRRGGQIWNGTKGALYNFGTHKDTEVRGQQRTFGKDWLPAPSRAQARDRLSRSIKPGFRTSAPDSSVR